MTSSIDATAARLASSLALAEGKKSIDLCPVNDKRLLQPDVFMVGKLITARDYKMRSFLGYLLICMAGGWIAASRGGRRKKGPLHFLRSE